MARHVQELWDRLHEMENEERFGGNSYPNGMCKFPFHLIGQGFFPGGDGLWRGETKLDKAGDGKLPEAGVMFIGNDFGTLSSFLKLKDKRYENVPTWRHLKLRIEKAGIPKRQTFFTNCIMGLREHGSALDKNQPGLCPAFERFCGEFLRFQLDLLSPRLVVLLGPMANRTFESVIGRGCSFRVHKSRHPYADFGLSEAVRRVECEELATAWASSFD